MSYSHYKWAVGQEPPTIGQHSIAKHEILRTYLLSYIQTLVHLPQQDVFRLTLVDGFSGGGVYRHEKTNAEILGSPFIMLQAMKEAEFLLNQNRRKPVKLLVDNFFIDSDKKAIDFLEHKLILMGYKEQLEKNIFLRNTKFQEESENIVKFIQNKGKKARAIFLLDQYGYKNVPTHLLRYILSSIPGSEIILTFAVDSLINFISDNDISQKILSNIGLPNIFRERSIEEIKKSEKDWRFFIQSCLYSDLVHACNARYYTVFFIRSTQGHGDYWLIHLSQHHRARDVMTQTHWKHSNYSIHYGGAGLNMFHSLGYSPDKDNDLFGFYFDDNNKQQSISTLCEHIPREIYTSPDGMLFREFFGLYCNETPATSEMTKKSLELLIQAKELEVISSDNKRRYSANTIHDNDLIIPAKQRKLF